MNKTLEENKIVDETDEFEKYICKNNNLNII
jgi:hypothetical protein